MKRLDRIDFHNTVSGCHITTKGYVRPELYDQILVINLDITSSKAFENLRVSPSLEIIANILTNNIFGDDNCTITVTDTSTNVSKAIYYGFSNISTITLGVTTTRNLRPAEKEQNGNYWITLVAQKPNVHIDTKLSLYHHPGEPILENPNRNNKKANKNKKSYYIQS